MHYNGTLKQQQLCWPNEVATLGKKNMVVEQERVRMMRLTNRLCRLTLNIRCQSWRNLCSQCLRSDCCSCQRKEIRIPPWDDPVTYSFSSRDDSVTADGPTSAESRTISERYLTLRPKVISTLGKPCFLFKSKSIARLLLNNFLLASLSVN